MIFRVGVGESDFAALRRSGKYYVDKTAVMYELVEETENKVTLFTRPRRFGKTLMMSMLSNFFSIRKDSREIFEGLGITAYKEFCEKWMNQFPVLFLSYKDVKAETFKGAYRMLKTKLADLCKELDFLLEETAVNSADRDIFRKLMFKTAEEDDVKNSLKTIMRMLYAVYGRKTILLIDEYDVPLARASEKNTVENAYYSAMLDVIKGMMGTALKDNEFLEFSVITGCLRIAKESIFTGTNNFASYSVLDADFSEYFGFSEEEVKKMLLAADRQDKADLIKEWYDGYIFGDSFLYCPWDVMNYMSALKKRENAKPKNYWKNTSHNGILLTFVKRTDFKVRGKIPNREIASIFEDTVVKLFQDTMDDNCRKDMMEALWRGDEREASEAISNLLWKTISYNDYHEDYYHVFLAGAFVGLGYEVESNKEKGLGRPDIFLKDDDNRRVIIIETKRSKKEDNLDQDCDRAVSQILSKKYAEGLYGYTQILCYGIAFFQKEARVKRLL